MHLILSIYKNAKWKFNLKVHFLYHFETWLLNRWKNKIITLLPSEEINNLHHALPTVLKLAVFKLQNFFYFFMYFHEQIIFQFHTVNHVTSVQSVIFWQNTGMLIPICQQPFQKLYSMIHAARYSLIQATRNALWFSDAFGRLRSSINLRSSLNVER